MRKAKVTINGEKLHASSEILRALAHPLRMQILEFIDQNEWFCEAHGNRSAYGNDPFGRHGMLFATRRCA